MFLLVIFVLLILVFVITGFLVRAYRARERSLAQDWNSRGKVELRSGHAGAAIADFRNALSHARDNALYQLQLAQALAEAGQFQQARNYLLNLRDREPGNGLVNLELARLAVRENVIPEAVRYFHDAVYSEWVDNPVRQRRAVRMELAKFLLDSDQKVAARAELIAVAGNLPPDAELRTQVGALLVKAGGYDDALQLFRQALAAEPRSAPALAGAGECYFQTGQYAQAERYLARALQQDVHPTRTSEMLETARSVLGLNPFIRRLAAEERARRAKLDFFQAMSRLEACAAQRAIDLKAPGANELQTLYADATGVQPRVRESILRRDSGLLFKVTDLVFEIEKVTAQVCGEPQGQDLALLLIAQQQEGGRP
jgi:predicted Zn-dependent protease